MPTHDEDPTFRRDWSRLSEAQQEQFIIAMRKMVHDLRLVQGFRPGLRVKAVQGQTGVFEMTWADDGRATFEFGAEVQPGEQHIIWRRIGTRDILKRP